jgi:hypothetical protein
MLLVRLGTHEHHTHLRILIGHLQSEDIAIERPLFVDVKRVDAHMA